jgi:hypothetical protein
MSSIPKSISTFSPGLNAGRPKPHASIRNPSHEHLQLQLKLTKIWATRTSECVAQETAPTAARGFACLFGSLDQPLPLALLHHDRTPVDLPVKHHNRFAFILSGLNICESACAALAGFLSSWCRGIERLAGGYRACEIRRLQQGCGVNRRR